MPTSFTPPFPDTKVNRFFFTGTQAQIAVKKLGDHRDELCT